MLQQRHMRHISCYVDSVILRALAENPGLSGHGICRHSVSTAISDVANKKTLTGAERADQELIAILTLSEEAIFRQLDVLLNAGAVNFNVEEDSWALNK